VTFATGVLLGGTASRVAWSRASGASQLGGASGLP
jgi:hypothetical protein